jgi:hypothetical protein
MEWGRSKKEPNDYAKNDRIRKIMTIPSVLLTVVTHREGEQGGGALTEIKKYSMSTTFWDSSRKMVIKNNT